MYCSLEIAIATLRLNAWVRVVGGPQSVHSETNALPTPGQGGKVSPILDQGRISRRCCRRHRLSRGATGSVDGSELLRTLTGTRPATFGTSLVIVRVVYRLSSSKAEEVVRRQVQQSSHATSSRQAREPVVGSGIVVGTVSHSDVAHR